MLYLFIHLSKNQFFGDCSELELLIHQCLDKIVACLKLDVLISPGKVLGSIFAAPILPQRKSPPPDLLENRKFLNDYILSHEVEPYILKYGNSNLYMEGCNDEIVYGLGRSQATTQETLVQRAII